MNYLQKYLKENHKTVKILALLKFQECFQLHIFYPITEPTQLAMELPLTK